MVHLGGISTEKPFDDIVQANIMGAYNLYEAARIHGTRRIVFASSNHVTGFYRQDEVVDTAAPVRPDGYYGLSKAFGENLARFYYDRYGIETVAIRIGSSFPEPKDRRMLATWMSYDDLRAHGRVMPDLPSGGLQRDLRHVRQPPCLVGQHLGQTHWLPPTRQLRAFPRCISKPSNPLSI